MATIDVIEQVFFNNEDDVPPSILTADLNSLPNGEVLKKLESYGWVDYQEGGPYKTHSSVKPNKQIDYILYRTNKKWKVKSFYVMYGEESSDHLPVVMDLMVQ